MKLWTWLKEKYPEIIIVSGIILIFSLCVISQWDELYNQVPKTAYTTRADCTHAAIEHDKPELKSWRNDL